MYLSKLKGKEKYSFLELAFNLANSDGEFSDKENDLIKAYCEEMSIKMFHVNFSHSREVAIKNIEKKGSDLSKRIVIFEMLRLAMIDGVYDDVEKEFIEFLAERFGVGEDFIQKSREVITEYEKAKKNMDAVVFD